MLGAPSSSCLKSVLRRKCGFLMMQRAEKLGSGEGWDGLPRSLGRKTEY